MKRLVEVVAIIALLALTKVACASEATYPSTKSPPASSYAMFEPIVITGSGYKTSPPFTVTTKEWVIDWSYVPDSKYPEYAAFSFFVYPRGETAMLVEAMLSTEGTSGSTYSYAGAGEYYIKVHAANVNSWRVVISPA